MTSKGKNPLDTRDQTLFLKALSADGIEEIYWPRSKKLVGSSGTALQDGVGADNESKGPRERLIDLRAQVLRCTQCDELVKNRTHVVFGAGNAHAELVFVGEAPGRDEDLQGLPFVGRAGQLLTKIIESIGLSRRQVFICNVLKCRPPGNRQPHPDEILSCQSFLQQQIELIRPKLICALGTFAAQALLKTGMPISKLRGTFHEYEGIKVICTFHPAYLLRNPHDKRKVWDDMKKIRKELNQPTP